MSEHEWAEGYEIAMQRFEANLRQNPDGTFDLKVDDPRLIGVDNLVIFADLKRSLDETNRQIKLGNIDPKIIGPYGK
jgi:hypothetical protein